MYVFLKDKLNNIINSKLKEMGDNHLFSYTQNRGIILGILEYDKIGGKVYNEISIRRKAEGDCRKNRGKKGAVQLLFFRGVLEF